MSEFTLDVMQKVLNDSKGAWDKLGQALADSMYDESQMPGKMRLIAEYQEKNPKAPIIEALGYAATETERLRILNYVRRGVSRHIKEVSEKIGTDDPLIYVLKESAERIAEGAMMQFMQNCLRSINLLDDIIEALVISVINHTTSSAASFRKIMQPVTMVSTFRHHLHLRSTVGARLVREAWKL